MKAFRSVDHSDLILFSYNCDETGRQTDWLPDRQTDGNTAVQNAAS